MKLILVNICKILEITKITFTYMLKNNRFIFLVLSIFNLLFIIIYIILEELQNHF